MKRLRITFITILFCTLLISCNDEEFVDPNPGTVYFLVAEYMNPEKGDSYILPLSDTNDIQTAREILANPDPDQVPDRIVVAKIVRQEANATLKNKDLLQNITWSWSVSEFMGFTGSTVEILDGNPSMVEEDIEFWFQNTSNSSDFGMIGFWGYSIIREVDPAELK